MTTQEMKPGTDASGSSGCELLRALERVGLFSGVCAVRTLTPQPWMYVPRTCPFGERVQQRLRVVRQISREEREDRHGEGPGRLRLVGEEGERQTERKGKSRRE